MKRRPSRLPPAGQGAPPRHTPAEQPADSPPRSPAAGRNADTSRLRAGPGWAGSGGWENGHAATGPRDREGRQLLAEGTAIRRWQSLAVILIAVLMAQFDLFVVNVAAPSIQAGLHATPASIQTAVGAYSLTYGTFLITGGRLGDAFGQAFMLRIGMVLFAASSVLCAISQTSIELIAGRVLQGACAAIMVPQVLALVTRLFPVSERRVATSWFGVTLGLGAVLGQSLGGVLVSHSPFGYGWRTIFLIVVPLSLAASIGVARLLPGRPQGRTVAADPVGLAGFSATLLLLFACLTLLPDNGWPPWDWALVAAAGCTGAATIWWEKRTSRRNGNPIIDTVLFRNRTFQIGLLVNAAYFLAFGGFLFAMTFTLQNGIGETAEQSGLTFVPQGIAFAIASLIGVRLANRLGSRLITAGAAASTLACALLLIQCYTGGIRLGPAHLLPIMALLGIGNGLAIPAMIASVLQIVPRASSGTASGILTTAQQVAMAFGVAIFGSILAASVRHSPTGQAFIHGLAIDLVIATVLLGTGGLGSCFLPRQHQ